jgi:hypothetical protein
LGCLSTCIIVPRAAGRSAAISRAHAARHAVAQRRCDRQPARIRKTVGDGADVMIDAESPQHHDRAARAAGRAGNVGAELVAVANHRGLGLAHGAGAGVADLDQHVGRDQRAR